MKIGTIVRGLTVLTVWIGMTGCEWQFAGTGDGENFASWSDAYNWVNFSGTYRGVNALLVAPPSSTRGQDWGVTNVGSQTTQTVRNEDGGTAPAQATSLNGRVDNFPVVPGSVTIIFSGDQNSRGTFTDDGNGGLTGSFNWLGVDDPKPGTGTFNYQTGAWTLELEAPGFLVETEIRYFYAYYVAPEDTAPPQETEDEPEEKVTAGGEIYTFQVHQQGNKILITDNNGYSYSGVITGVATSGGDSTGTSSGDVIAQFEANGTVTGVRVRIVGTFRGTYTAPTVTEDGATTGSGTLTDRYIEGTWIENNTGVADIYGKAG